MTSPADRTAIELLAGYRSGELSPVDATQAVLERIDALDGAVNAFCLRDDDAALAAAKESAQRWAAGTPQGPLDGVPISIKDILYTAGRPTLRGSFTVDPDGPWPDDAPAVSRVREAGAVLVGKTTTPEYGWKGVTDSPRTGVTTNPWDPTKTAGGSSGGSAAAVGLGMGPLSVGTDGGGSVRIPAGFTGTTALKPTYGRVPVWPASPYGTLAHHGPMTRTAVDAALLLDVISGFDARDPWALVPVGGAFEALSTPVVGLRVAFSPTLGFAQVDPEIAQLVATAVETFAALGAHVEEVDPGFGDSVEAFETLWFSGAAKSLESIDDRSRMDQGLATIAEQGARYTSVEYLRAMAVRNELGILMGEFHSRFDLLLTPTLPIAAFEGGVEVPAGWPRERWTSWTPFTYPFNMTQQPAASVPCGFTAAGLPAGLQIVGPRHADNAVLAAAHAFQQATDWHARRPPLLG